MKYYIIVASKDHIAKGEKEGFGQAGHGKLNQLKKLAKEDWVIYYASKETRNGKPYQRFTAIGQVVDEAPFQVKVSEAFKPWRRKVRFRESKEIEIRPLLEGLHFIKDPTKWGLYLMSGFREVDEHDFKLISDAMLG
ncbi:MAG: EVE domain-containing protein [Cytophagaceae bacterium]|nr:EVE domain-containing protein [Cytophagaceae bacterium]|tara:strand:+ start:5111 stop:5521 length:411 start_codon:yes stop_codon:yes gene_type:complete